MAQPWPSGAFAAPDAGEALLAVHVEAVFAEADVRSATRWITVETDGPALTDFAGATLEDDYEIASAALGLITSLAGTVEDDVELTGRLIEFLYGTISDDLELTSGVFKDLIRTDGTVEVDLEIAASSFVVLEPSISFDFEIAGATLGTATEIAGDGVEFGVEVSGTLGLISAALAGAVDVDLETTGRLTPRISMPGATLDVDVEISGALSTAIISSLAGATDAADFELAASSLVVLPPPANDHFADADALVGTSGQVAFTLVRASLEAGELAKFAPYASNWMDDPERSLWYAVTAPAGPPAQYEVRLAHDSNSDLQWGLWTGDGLSIASLVAVPRLDELQGYTVVSFVLDAGETGWIQLLNEAEYAPEGTLSWEVVEHVVPTNGTADDAAPLTPVPDPGGMTGTVTQGWTAASEDPEDVGDRWWYWTADGEYSATLTLASTPADPGAYAEVYAGKSGLTEDTLYDQTRMIAWGYGSVTFRTQPGETYYIVTYIGVGMYGDLTLAYGPLTGGSWGPWITPELVWTHFDDDGWMSHVKTYSYGSRVDTEPEVGMPPGDLRYFPDMQQAAWEEAVSNAAKQDDMNLDLTDSGLSTSWTNAGEARCFASVGVYFANGGWNVSYGAFQMVNHHIVELHHRLERDQLPGNPDGIQVTTGNLQYKISQDIFYDLATYPSCGVSVDFYQATFSWDERDSEDTWTAFGEPEITILSFDDPPSAKDQLPTEPSGWNKLLPESESGYELARVRFPAPQLIGSQIHEFPDEAQWVGHEQDVVYVTQHRAGSNGPWPVYLVRDFTQQIVDLPGGRKMLQLGVVAELARNESASPPHFNEAGASEFSDKGASLDVSYTRFTPWLRRQFPDYRIWIPGPGAVFDVLSYSRYKRPIQNSQPRLENDIGFGRRLTTSRRPTEEPGIGFSRSHPPRQP